MIDDFRRRYGSADGVRIFRAPGRVNLIGETEGKQDTAQAILRDVPHCSPFRVAARRWRCCQLVLVAVVDDIAQLRRVERDMRRGGGNVGGGPAIDRGADAEAAEHRHAQAEREITPQAGCCIGVVVASDAARRPFDQPVVAGHRGMRELGAEMDREFAQ